MTAKEAKHKSDLMLVSSMNWLFKQIKEVSEDINKHNIIWLDADKLLPTQKKYLKEQGYGVDLAADNKYEISW